MMADSTARLGSGSARVRLNEGEQVIARYSCYRYTAAKMLAGGELFLTDARLIWTPSFLWPFATVKVIARSSIVAIENYNFYRAPNSWRVVTLAKPSIFSFGIFPDPKKDENLKAITQWANI